MLDLNAQLMLPRLLALVTDPATGATPPPATSLEGRVLAELRRWPHQDTADAIGPNLARLRREHHRHLGNGYCTRPPELDCAFESICETCTFFQTSIEFRPTLQTQHDDAETKHQSGRAELFSQLLDTLGEDAS